MATRRTFLTTTVAVGALPLSVYAAAPRRLALRQLAEIVCPEAQAFAAGAAAASRVCEHDPAELLFNLENDLDRGAIDAIFGLTRSSTQFLVKQCAARFDFELCYQALHKFDGDTVAHRLEGDTATVQAMRARLRVAPKAWARTLGELAHTAMASGSLEDAMAWRERSPAAGEPWQLHSWLLRRT